MSLFPYIGPRAVKRLAAGLALPLLLAGCSMSLFGGSDQPKTTGSIEPQVDVQGPIPKSLAFSDAAMIGAAARVALLQAQGGNSNDWINASTGSSGTIQTVDLPAPPAGNECRPFSTTVTSIGGVHEYSGAICPDFSGRPRMKIDERAATDRS
jgi:surface antigen